MLLVYQKWMTDITVYVPKIPLPMGSLSGAAGYGVIHPSMINEQYCSVALRQAHIQNHHTNSMHGAKCCFADVLQDSRSTCTDHRTMESRRKEELSLDMIIPPGSDGDPASLISDTRRENMQEEVRLLLGGEPFRSGQAISAILMRMPVRRSSISCSRAGCWSLQSDKTYSIIDTSYGSPFESISLHKTSNSSCFQRTRSHHITR